MSKEYHQYTDGDLVDCGIDLKNMGEYTLSDIAKLLGVSRGKARGILINLSLLDDIKKGRKEYACWENVDIEEFKRLYREKTGKELCR